MQTGTLPLAARRHTTLRLALPFADDAGPVRLTNWSARMQVRAAAGADGPALLDIGTGLPTTAGSRLSVDADGALEILIVPADVSALPVNTRAPGEPMVLAYDIILREPGGDQAAPFEGTFTVYPSVTQADPV